MPGIKPHGVKNNTSLSHCSFAFSRDIQPNIPAGSARGRIKLIPYKFFLLELAHKQKAGRAIFRLKNGLRKAIGLLKMRNKLRGGKTEAANQPYIIGLVGRISQVEKPCLIR